MKQMIAKTALLVTVLALGACTMIWGKSYTQVDSSPDMVKYEYYLNGLNEERMEQEARDYCAEQQKEAVLQAREGNDKMTSTYICVPRIVYIPSAVPIDTK